MHNVRFWVSPSTPVDGDTYEQIQKMTQLPILAGPIAIMPDVHQGRGGVVGSVLATRGAVVPATVGTDIACGMQAIQTSVRTEQLPDTLRTLREAIERQVPIRFIEHPDAGIPESGLRQRIHQLRQRFPALRLHSLASSPLSDARLWNQLGTLGSGNHFVEVNTGTDGYVWITLHSGSRGAGALIGQTAIDLAYHQCLERGITLSPHDLAWLADGTPAFDAYWEAMLWAHDYALLNRDIMAHRLWQALLAWLPPGSQAIRQTIQIHHNYIEPMLWDGETIYVTRKGAVSARAGEWGIIPGAMNRGTYIVQGKGNPASYYSCSHGAGRRLSRSAAKTLFTLDDVQEQTQGLESRKDLHVRDELPAAYKDLDAVMAAQQDLVEPMVLLQPVLCIKG